MKTRLNLREKKKTKNSGNKVITALPLKELKTDHYYKFSLPKAQKSISRHANPKNHLKLPHCFSCLQIATNSAHFKKRKYLNNNTPIRDFDFPLKVCFLSFQLDFSNFPRILEISRITLVPGIFLKMVGHPRGLVYESSFPLKVFRKESHNF